MNALYAQVKIGENIEEVSPFALLELESSSRGVLLPRMTSNQRDAAFDQATPVGIMIFNLDANAIQYFVEEIDPATKKRQDTRCGRMLLTKAHRPRQRSLQRANWDSFFLIPKTISSTIIPHRVGKP